MLRKCQRLVPSASASTESPHRPKAQGFSKAPRKEEPEGEEPPKGGRVGVNKYNVQVGKKKLLPVRTEDWEVSCSPPTHLRRHPSPPLVSPLPLDYLGSLPVMFFMGGDTAVVTLSESFA